MIPSQYLLWSVLLVGVTEGQDFMSMITPFLGSGLAAVGGGGGKSPLGSPNSFLGSMMPFIGNGGAGTNDPFSSIMSMFNRPPPPGPSSNAHASNFLSPATDYDDQVVHSKKGLGGHKSKGARKWKPLGEHYSKSIEVEQRPHRPIPAPVVKTTRAPVPSISDYEDDIDLSLTGANLASVPQQSRSVPPPPQRFRPARLADPVPGPLHAVRINRRIQQDQLIPSSIEEGKAVPNIVGEISSLSAVHQTPNGDYGSVEKIMTAFNQLFSDPKKPKREIVADGTEVGRNRALSAHLFESDIVLTVPQMKSIVLTEKERIESVYKRRQKRKVITGSVYRWPKGRPIPYTMKSNDPQWKEMIVSAMRMWEGETCIRFQENYGAQDYIQFYKGSGCFSSVGKTGGSQMISIGYGCDNVGIIAHEIAHTLGFWHEQSRPDRDYYIRIRREYIASGTEGNFLKQSYAEADSMGLPYDLGSVMHYGPEAFTTRADSMTIETKDTRFESTIGQRIKPSFIDIKQMNRLYCSDACRGMQLACRNGGYPDPNECQKCKCPEGLGGPICDQIDSGECPGNEMIATGGWQEMKHEGMGDCVWRIRTKNAKIRIRLSNVNFHCERTCTSYVEIKSANDLQQTGFRTCCLDADVNVVSEGETALILVRSNGLKRKNSFRIQYVKVDSRTEEIVEAGSSSLIHKAPAIKPWVEGQENRAFRGVDNGPVETFILNSIGKLTDSPKPEMRIAGAISHYALSSLFGKKR